MNSKESKTFAAEIRKEMPELDLHGLFPEEINNRVDLFLYENYKNKEASVKIIYGIGKGVLRKEVLSFLQNHPLVDKIINKEGSCLVLLVD